MTRATKSTASLLVLAVCLAVAPVARAASDSAPKLSKKDRLAALPAEERKWLTEFVAPIIQPEEEALFLKLTEPYQREIFKKEFWERRETEGLVPPLGPGYEERYAELRRLADEKYDGWRQEAGRLVLSHGEPDELDTLFGCDEYLRNVEIWRYVRFGASGRGRREYILYRTIPLAPRRLWHSGVPVTELYLPDRSPKCLVPTAAERRRPDDPEVDCACRIEALIRENLKLHSATGGYLEASKALAPPKVSTEGIERILDRFASVADPKAKPIAVEGPGETGFVRTSSVQAAAPAGAQPPNLSKKQRVAALPEDDRKWLTEYVEPIILPDEEKLFLELTQPHQREMFKEEFWQRRERNGLAAPFGPGYRQRYEHLRDVAATEYDGLTSDAGRMVVRWGEPTRVEEIGRCEDVFRQVEVWSYKEGQGSARQHIFYRPAFGSARKLWSPGLGDRVLLQPASCVAAVAELCMPPTGATAASAANDPTCASGVGSKRCDDGCRVARIAETIRARRGETIAELGLISQPPSVSTEGLDALRQRLAGLSNRDAKPISVAGGSGVVPTANVQTPPPAPAAPAKQLSKKELIAALPEDDRKWLTEYVAPIIRPEEEAFFLKLTEPHQRESFKEAFWARREKTALVPPLGPGYRHRYEELRRLADEKYDGWRNDAGRMVLRWGEPAEIDQLSYCGDLTRELEIWKYAGLGGSGRQQMQQLFYRPGPGSPRRLWNTSVSERELYSPAQNPLTPQQQVEECVPGRPASLNPSLPQPYHECICKLFEFFQQAKALPGYSPQETARLMAPPEVAAEDLTQIADKFPILPNAKAKTIGVEGPGSTPAASAAPAQAAAKPGTDRPAPTHRKLSGKEVKELTAALAKKYRDWLVLVELIITKEEREVFLQISDDYQKDRFIESFWRRRSIDSQGIRTDYQAVHTRRVEIALEQFKNLNNDRAKILIINGPPDSVLPIDCPEVYVPIQIWYYDRLESLKSKVYLIFYAPYGVGDYKLWLPLDGEGVLTVGGGFGSGARVPTRRVEFERCAEARTLRQAMAYSTAVLGSGATGLAGSGKLFQPPTIETEGVDQILTMTTELATGSAPLGVTKLVRFPELRANKIGVDLSLLVPKSDLKSRDLGEEKFYNVDVIGEVIKGERLIDNFKYRFDIPTHEVGSDKIPLTVRRYLYPGEYNLVLKVSDGNQSAEGRITDKLTVPEQPDAPPPQLAEARAEGRATVEKARDLGLVASAISLLPVAKEIVTGLQRFETKAAEGVKAVDFYLNGSKVMTKTRPPFDADLNLGPLPRKHTVRVVAFGSAGRAIGEDEYTVNEGREIFRVRILNPEKGARVSGPVRVVAAVAVPEGKSLQKLEIYSNERRVATLYQPPFEQTVTISQGKSLGYVRIVGTLEDGAVAEDLRYVNAPAYISEVSVDAVELYATVTDKNRPVQGLQASNFKVFEDGAIQKIESFEYVKNLPLTLGVLIDTSASMLESLSEAQQAALSFLDFSLGAKDRAFTVSFDNEPYLLTKLTNRKDRVFRSLAGLRAEGSTALYDAIIYGLYQFTGVKGKKALVVLSDGKDTASKFDYETLVEYVKKAGISIYGIGLKISGADLEVKYKLNKLAQATGGQTFYVDSAKNLEAVYRQINEDLRSQYLLTYYSTNTSGKDKWRKVEVKVEPTSLQARTISGYYP